ASNRNLESFRSSSSNCRRPTSLSGSSFWPTNDPAPREAAWRTRTRVQTAVFGECLAHMLFFPIVGVNQSVDRQAREPPEGFELRTRKEIAHIAKAEIGHENDVRRNTEEGAQLGRVKDADPAHPNAFRARRKPQILYRAAGAVHVDLADGVAAEHIGAVPARVAGHANIERCFANAFEIHSGVHLAALSFEDLGGGE